MAYRKHSDTGSSYRRERTDYINYVLGISFRFIKPRTPIPGWFAKLLQKLCGITLEFTNTTLPFNELEMKDILHEISEIPRMSTLAIGAMINRGVSQMPENEVFVNVGVWHGFTLLSGMIDNPQKKCIGVDNFSEFGNPRKAFLERFNRYKSPKHRFYEMDYVDYFSDLHKDPIGFYLYDGNHSYGNQLKGLQTAEPFFSPNCIILIDDVNYHEPRQATKDFVSNSSHEYRILLDSPTYCNHHPTLWNGIMMLQMIR